MTVGQPSLASLQFNLFSDAALCQALWEASSIWVYKDNKKPTLSQKAIRADST